MASVKQYHPDWEHRLWTDYAMELHVRRQHPRLYPIYMASNCNIMRVDVCRYVLMHDFGGLYCDLHHGWETSKEGRRLDYLLPKVCGHVSPLVWCRSGRS